MIWEYANGIDDSKVKYEEEKPKGIGNSITLPYDIDNIEKLDEVLMALCEHVGYRLRKIDMLGNTVSVQIKTKDFKVYSKQRKMISETNSTIEIYNEARKLLQELKGNFVVRLLGIRVDGLEDKESKQISLFEIKEDSKHSKIDKAMDEIKMKFGYNSVTRASKMQIENLIGNEEENHKN